MRPLNVLLVTLALLVASTNAVSADTAPTGRSLTDVNNDVNYKRSLRTHRSSEDDDDDDERMFGMDKIAKWKAASKLKAAEQQKTYEAAKAAQAAKAAVAQKNYNAIANFQNFKATYVASV
ncbi:hypothetical protein BBO99_00008659 [Phytophthora kernoviae]|uniref:RxLR effector protein n=2 Tax=Phytophthora kernoviae TaxID=325452 RepID=A0A3R7K6X4_9STRA|nr:hypothetical protein G195_010456 [Phytophthora kernoviae 00238/432]KAG2508572.1 hypothetical protein JM16_008821 [Phytophthora kernoviae]KAG2510765.1 hypothetical protein JM18_008847 [Phytophthora kernoviae]RLN26751.1 hypothetical protein BBI17_004290 [Phytophthora kernoviae]RLN74929.1 hypothetical protein BBO99_00008659 [Phytophthora kernoviae]